MTIEIDAEGIAALCKVMRAQRQSLVSADQSAVAAIGAAGRAVTTTLVGGQLARIGAELSQAVDAHSTYTEWFISVLEENAAAYIAYDEFVAQQLEGFAANPDLTPRYP